MTIDYSHLGRERHLLSILKHPKLSKKQAKAEALHKKVNLGSGKKLTKSESKFKTRDWPTHE